jgi:hypothetical protein
VTGRYTQRAEIAASELFSRKRLKITPRIMCRERSRVNGRELRRKLYLCTCADSGYIIDAPSQMALGLVRLPAMGSAPTLGITGMDNVT